MPKGTEVSKTYQLFRKLLVGEIVPTLQVQQIYDRQAFFCAAGKKSEALLQMK
jgi:hypothetical protein